MKNLLLLFIFLSLPIFCVAQVDILLKPNENIDKKENATPSKWYKNYENWLQLHQPNQQKLDLAASKEKKVSPRYTIKIIRPDLSQYPTLVLPLDTMNYNMPNLFDRRRAK
jgi:hypothetical protein